MSLSSFGEIIGQEILLDEDAFVEASRRMAALVVEMNNLRNQVSGLLDELRRGFQTPAGAKFFQACGSNLLQPLDDQKRVIDHVSENLRNARQSYESVFQEFRALNDQIESIR